MAAKTKSFKTQFNPAMQFITQQPEELTRPKAAEAPEGYKVNPAYIETKSRRVQLLMQPSLYAQIKELASGAGCSVNDFIHNILNDYANGE